MSTQFEIKDNENMCCGISYFAIMNRSNLLRYYFSNDFEKYRLMFERIMMAGSVRKLNNPKIKYEGEFINEKTIEEDFPEIFFNMDYKEFGIGNIFEDSNSNIEAITKIFTSAKYYEPIIICKDAYVFIFIKLDSNSYLLMDSHIPIHGKLNLSNVIMWITFGGNYNGIVTVGYFKK